MVLRQHYLVGGESLINEWHAQFLAERRRSASEAARSEAPPRGSAVQLLSALRDRLKARMALPTSPPAMPCAANSIARSTQPPPVSAVQLLSALRDRLKARSAPQCLICHAMPCHAMLCAASTPCRPVVERL